jgi:amino acid transporter
MPFGLKSIFAALPLAGVIYSFIGFNPAVQLAAEAKNPARAIPVAIFGALFICMIIYVLVQVAFIGALPAVSLSQGFSAVTFIGDKGPFAGLLTLLGFAFFVKALYVDAVVSPFGTALVQSVATSRITYAMSQNYYFPAYFMQVNKSGTPVYALLLNMFIGLLFFLPFPSWQHMVGFLVSCLVLGYVVGPLSLMALAHKKPHAKKIHVLCLLAFIICNFLIYWSSWLIVYKIMILFMIGYILLGVTILKNKGFASREKLHFKRGCWVIFYLMGTTLISYWGSFGGTHLIPFGMDFLVIGIFSVVIYTLAYYLTREGAIS